MDWSNYTLDHSFIGRRQELDFLARELLLSQPKITAITGSPGSGKTALAMAFAYQYGKAFPAGTYHVYATPFEPLQATIATHVSNPSSPHLLILDELESLQSLQLNIELLELRRARPSARMICISRHPNLTDVADSSLQLERLKQADFHEFLQKLKFFGGGPALDEEAYEALGGNPLLARLTAEYLHSSSLTPRQVIEYLRSFSQSGIVGLDGLPLAKESAAEKIIIADVQAVTDDLLARAYAEPKLLYQITPRRFEEFVAELLNHLGYDVTLTPASKDGGKDIYAAKRDDLGSFLYIVECKQYSPDRRVGVGLIRELNGVVQAERATAGILATTAFFTKGAREFQERLSNQISLKDYIGIQEWLSKVFHKGHLPGKYYRFSR